MVLDDVCYSKMLGVNTLTSVCCLRSHGLSHSASSSWGSNALCGTQLETW